MSVVVAGKDWHSLPGASWELSVGSRELPVESKLYMEGDIKTVYFIYII